MIDRFKENMRLLMLVVAKSASKHPDSPFTYGLIEPFINTMFNNNDNVEDMRSQYNNYKTILGPSYYEMIESNDRNLFKVMRIFPSYFTTNYPEQEEWYTNYVINTMEQRLVDCIFKYIRAIK